ncbi:hypothetical protein BDV40DRAFT_207845 [Aspergillus tamarii]|uniref:Uncharacterized protein n=1 Tax=Aspergillus tamarii TaxID=41984 RepID=A0A5N6V8I0_ASPTM|nr:hypothetical protein BDV40DRAFT_207845 [Aspergillus tamarii]
MDGADPTSAHLGIGQSYLKEGQAAKAAEYLNTCQNSRLAVRLSRPLLSLGEHSAAELHASTLVEDASDVEPIREEFLAYGLARFAVNDPDRSVAIPYLQLGRISVPLAHAQHDAGMHEENIKRMKFEDIADNPVLARWLAGSFEATGDHLAANFLARVVLSDTSGDSEVAALTRVLCEQNVPYTAPTEQRLNAFVAQSQCTPAVAYLANLAQRPTGRHSWLLFCARAAFVDDDSGAVCVRHEPVVRQSNDGGALELPSV